MAGRKRKYPSSYTVPDDVFVDLNESREQCDGPEQEAGHVTHDRVSHVGHQNPHGEHGGNFSMEQEQDNNEPINPDDDENAGNPVAEVIHEVHDLNDVNDVNYVNDVHEVHEVHELHDVYNDLGQDLRDDDGLVNQIERDQIIHHHTLDVVEDEIQEDLEIYYDALQDLPQFPDCKYDLFTFLLAHFFLPM